MKLWLLEQSVNYGWDTYDSAVVAAQTSDAARRIHPGTVLNSRWSGPEDAGNWLWLRGDGSFIVESGSDWAPISAVTATHLGTAKPGTPEGVICASFNAG